MFKPLLTAQTAIPYNGGVKPRLIWFAPLLALVLDLVTFSPRVPASSSAMSSAAWRGDVRAFAEGVESRHKNAFHSVAKPVFTAAVVALEDRLPKLEDHEVVVGLMELAALIGDGHTFVADSAGAYLNRRLPMRFEWLDGALWW